MRFSLDLYAADPIPLYGLRAARTIRGKLELQREDHWLANPNDLPRDLRQKAPSAEPKGSHSTITLPVVTRHVKWPTERVNVTR